jgi:dTDP-4-amino-4,6-dideoxygalactose transaminase
LGACGNISTGGEGGMLLLDDEQAYKNAWAYKDIGRSYDAVYHQEHAEGFRWLTESAGSNFRMTEFQAAIGLKQLEKLPRWIKQRNNNANEIIEILNQFDFIDLPTMQQRNGNCHAYYRLYAKVRKEALINGIGGDLRAYHVFLALAQRFIEKSYLLRLRPKRDCPMLLAFLIWDFVF